MRFSHYDGKQPKQVEQTGGGGGTTTTYEYSLEEKVVGKWVDGTTDVYEKTYIVNKQIVESGFGATKQLISAVGSYINKANDLIAFPSIWAFMFVNHNTNELTVSSNDSSIDYDKINYITVRYIYKEV